MICICVCIAAVAIGELYLVRAAASDDVALTGTVSSKSEARMEGVLVSAKKEGSNVTITVVSDDNGRYRFPRNRLTAGKYAVTIRAIGYEMDAASVEIRAAATATLDLKLHEARDLASQLTSAEWLLSMPGTDEQKAALLDCTGCHTLERVVRSHHGPDEWPNVTKRMDHYASGSSPLRPQIRRGLGGPQEHDMAPQPLRQQSEFLSSINLSSAPTWKYSLKTLPRPKGSATHVIITEYDLPRHDAMPHDVVVDPEGFAWYTDFGFQYFGKVDPKTGTVIEYPVPEPKPGFPQGANDLEVDKQGNLWIGMMNQGAIAKFDRKTQKFQVWRLPPGLDSDLAQQAMVMPRSKEVDGKVWLNNIGIRGLHRLDLVSGKFETFEPYRDIPKDSPLAGRRHSVYGVSVDSHNNAYFHDFGDESIGEVDAKTGKMKLYPTPTPKSRPRRGNVDAEDRLWFAEYATSKFALFDTRTKQFQEWPMPSPWAGPYDVVRDRNAELWTGGMMDDRVVRLDPKTGRATAYLLPRSTNIRRVFVDNSNTPVAFWVGSNLGASVVKLEPLD